MPESLFASMLRISLTTGIIIIAIVILSSRLNRRYVSGWKYWLWLLLAVRMLVPVNFELADPPMRVQIPDAIVTAPVRPVVLVPSELLLPEATAQAQLPDAPSSLSVIELAGTIWLLGAAVFLLWKTC